MPDLQNDDTSNNTSSNGSPKPNTSNERKAEAQARMLESDAKINETFSTLLTLVVTVGNDYLPVTAAHAKLMTVELEEKAQTARSIESAKRVILEGLSKSEGKGNSPSDKLDIIERITRGY